MRASLLTDGSSDRVLVYVLEWLLAEAGESQARVEWIDTRMIRPAPTTLEARVRKGLELYPTDLLFVHRDAEAQDPERRYAEITQAVSDLAAHVAVVPVRMQEAWLLHDVDALRRAAGRPSGTENLKLPAVRDVHTLSTPKALLHEALRVASGLTGRRLKQFDPAQQAHRLASLVDDWSPLREQASFRRLEKDAHEALARFRSKTRGEGEA